MRRPATGSVQVLRNRAGHVEFVTRNPRGEVISTVIKAEAEARPLLLALSR